MLALSVHRQRAFVRSLGRLAPHPDGTWRSAAAAEPMLVGALPPRIVLPLDFDLRYSPEERDLVLAHELAHVRRGDPLANALSAACLCAFWFNPLMYWAASSLRFDQDLACDASVLDSAGTLARRRYVAALVKTQMPRSSWTAARLACHWRSAHPLTRRIALLNQPLTGRKRHVLDILLVSTLAVSASLATELLLPPGNSSLARTAGPVHTAQVCPLTRRRLATHPSPQTH
jgi:beta-lactamase regulating signal transducer with metallopeptidase domain